MSERDHTAPRGHDPPASAEGQPAGAQPCERLVWRVGPRRLDLGHRGLIMGILNVTPDSFSDGGRHQRIDQAVAHAEAMLAEGADIIDVGGESTRPGASPVDAATETARTIPVIERLRRSDGNVLISIDTAKASVARAALDAGADIVNDVTALRGDPAMIRVVADSDCGIVLMHMQGEPRTMQADPRYEDVVSEVAAFLGRRVADCAAAGIDPHRLAVDPGIGFGKTLEHNLALLRALPRLAAGNRPILLGVSRKSLFARILGDEAMESRQWPTVALTSLARETGARIFRVHDVRLNSEALRMTEAILAG